MIGLDLEPFDGAATGDAAPIVLLGGSYVASWTLRRVAGRPVVNKGIEGARTHDYVERFERDVAALRPRAVVIWGVDDDIIGATRGATAEACWCAERNLEALVGLAGARGIEPILATDLTLRPPARWSEWVAGLVGRLRGKEGYHRRINGHVLRLNAFIRDLAQQTGVRLLDLQPLVSARNGMRARRHAKLDGSRLTHAGYRAIERYAVPRLARWLAEPLSSPAPRTRASGR